MPAQSVDRPVRLPMYDPLDSRTSIAPFTKDSRLYNAYAEMSLTDQTYWIYKRVGLGPTPIFSTESAAPGLGLYTEVGFNANWAIFGSQVYQMQPGQPWTLQRTVDASAPYFFETILGTTSTERIVVYGNGVHYYGTVIIAAAGGGGTREEAPGPLPFTTPFARGFAYLNGYLYVMDTATGNIWNTTNQFSIASWGGIDNQSYVPASSNADLGVALFKQLNYIVALKQYTTQVFYDAHNPAPGSPLSEVPDSQMPLGCLSGMSVQEIDNSLLWVTSNETISPQVVQVDSLVPRIVSTPAVDRMLDNMTWNDPNMDVRSWVLKHAGHRFYGLTLITNNITLVYDLDQKGWYIWTDANGNFWPIVAMAYLPPGNGIEGKHIVQHNNNGNIYWLDGDYVFPSDYGQLVPVDVYTPNFDAGVDRRKTLNIIRFNGDQTVGSQLQVRYSNDDYQSWSNFRSVDLGLERPILDQNGTFYRRAYHFRHQCNTSMRLRSVDLQLDIGSL